MTETQPQGSQVTPTGDIAHRAHGYRVGVTSTSPSGTLDRLRSLQIASVPSGHVYVRHLSPLDGTGSVRLPDPDPDSPDRSAVERWWPPVMLQPEWAADAEFDVFHLHFGFDSCEPAQLSRLLDVLRRRGKPSVFTVHDLRNPHHETRALHDAQLDVLIPAVDEIVTLTPGAASEIARRWSRRATVVPHPHVVDLRTMARLRDQRLEREQDPDRPFRVGVHVKSLRPSMDPFRLLPTLLRTVQRLPGAVLQVNGHRDVLDPDGARRDGRLAAWLHKQASLNKLELHVHDFLDDEALWSYLSSLDVSVLPYRFGTHSGWLEACRDLGTVVAAPTCGYYRDQGPILTYRADENSFDSGSLASAIEHAYAHRPDLGATVADRRAQRQRIAVTHEELYTRLAR